MATHGNRFGAHGKEGVERGLVVGGSSRPRRRLALKAIDVYGQPTDDALRRLRGKASLLGGNGVAVHALHAGFTRVDRQ